MASRTGGYSGKEFKGARREMLAVKRAQAENRNADTPHTRTKRHRLGRCDCDPGEVVT